MRLNEVVRITFFLYSSNLICRGTDISKYFRESLGLRDNESHVEKQQQKLNVHVVLFLTIHSVPEDNHNTFLLPPRNMAYNKRDCNCQVHSALDTFLYWDNTLKINM